MNRIKKCILKIQKHLISENIVILHQEFAPAKLDEDAVENTSPPFPKSLISVLTWAVLRDAEGSVPRDSLALPAIMTFTP